MKAKALTPAWFSGCPRYLTVDNFCVATGIANGKARIENLLERGAMPSRQFGRHLMVDMHELMLMLPSDPVQEEDPE